MKRLLAILLLLSTPAHATIRYVSYNATTGNGTIGNPWSLARANDSLFAGDVAILGPGTYATGISPTNAGTSLSSMITYVGSLDNPANTVVASLATSKSYVSIKGIETSSLGGTPWAGSFDSLSACILNVGVTFAGAANYNSISQCKIVGEYFSPNQADANLDSTAAKIRGLNVKQCLIVLTPTNVAIKCQGTESLTVERCTISITIGTDVQHGVLKLYDTRHSRWYDNHFSVENNNTHDTCVNCGCDECGTSYLRDATRFAQFVRDTFDFSGAGWLMVLPSASGTWGGTTYGNKWDQCVWRSTAPARQPRALLFWQNSARHDTLTNSVLIASDAGAISQYPGASGSAITSGSLWSNNTFISLSGDYSAIANTDVDAIGTTSAWKDNIIYGTEEFLVRGAVSAYTGDYDLAYLAGTTASQACIGPDHTVGEIYGFGSGFPMCNTYAQECHSTYQNPVFVSDSSESDPFNFDAHLATASSPAFTAGSSGGRVGALGLGGVKYYWVAPDGRGGLFTNTGADSVHPITLAAANGLARPGVTFVLLGGNYAANATVLGSSLKAPAGNASFDIGTNICPLGAGSAFDTLHVVRYATLWYYQNAIRKTANSSLDNNSYTVGNVIVPNEYVVVNGLKSGAATMLAGSTSECAGGCGITNPGTYCFIADHDSMTWCNFGAVQVVGVMPGVCTQVDTASATPTQITVKFTGAPNNTNLNSGTPSGYYIAYGTTADITDPVQGGNFFAHSYVLASGQSPGTTVTKTLTSLANSTIYYFAVVTLGTCGSLGAMSEVQCGATRRSNGASSTQNCREELAGTGGGAEGLGSSPDSTDGAPVLAFSLAPNRPNPFPTATAIDFTLPRTTEVQLVVFDAQGREVRLLSKGTFAPGRHSVVWNGRDDAGHELQTGVYLYRIIAGSDRRVRKMVLTR